MDKQILEQGIKKALYMANISIKGDQIYLVVKVVEGMITQSILAGNEMTETSAICTIINLLIPEINYKTLTMGFKI